MAFSLPVFRILTSQETRKIMSSVFTLENIGVDCSQDVSCMLNDVFSNLLAADDIPKDRLVSMLHSKDNTCSSEDIGWGFESEFQVDMRGERDWLSSSARDPIME